jgi:hypothetical protein
MEVFPICEKRTYVRVEILAFLSQDADRMATAPSKTTNGRRKNSKPRCEDCFFRQNLLCALSLEQACPTFRPAHPDGLRPPKQLSFVFRQERLLPRLSFQPPSSQLVEPSELPELAT